MEVRLEGGPFDGAVMQVPGWVDGLALSAGGKRHWYAHLGPPEESAETYTGVLSHLTDETYDRMTEQDLKLPPGGETWMDIARRNRECARQSLHKSLE